MLTLILIGIWTSVFGGMVMALGFAFAEIEAQRAQRAIGEIHVTGFLAEARPAEAPAPATGERKAVVILLEEYLKREQALAEDFVSEPSVARLHLDADRRAQAN